LSSPLSLCHGQAIVDQSGAETGMTLNKDKQDLLRVGFIGAGEMAIWAIFPTQSVLFVVAEMCRP